MKVLAKVSLVADQAHVVHGRTGKSASGSTIAAKLACALFVLGILGGCSRVDARRPGDAEKIPGVYHTVERGETIWSIASLYDVDELEVLDHNDIKAKDIRKLQVGRELFIPGAKEVKRGPGKSDEEPPVRQGLKEPERVERIDSEPFFVCPVEGPILRSFDEAAEVGPCKGLDIRVAGGAPVVAAKSGIVLECTAFEGWGNIILINHGSREHTFYGHLASVTVSPGERVKQAQIIGRAGSSGRVASPILHFRIYRNGEPIDPRGRFSH